MYMYKAFNDCYYYYYVILYQIIDSIDPNGIVSTMNMNTAMTKLLQRIQVISLLYTILIKLIDLIWV